MPITAQNIADKAALLLQDQTNIRWTEPELLGWINSGQREIMIYKPNANPVTGTVTTVAGTKQQLPSGGVQVLDVIRTINGSAVTNVDRNILDTTIPDWHTQTAAAAKHYMFDPRNPKVFYLYPPSVGSVAMEVCYSSVPADVATISDSIFNDLYETVLLDYVLYRAYSKDTEHTANQALVTQHYQAFIAALQSKTGAEVGLAPKRKFASAQQQQ